MHAHVYMCVGCMEGFFTMHSYCHFGHNFYALIVLLLLNEARNALPQFCLLMAANN